MTGGPPTDDFFSGDLMARAHHDPCSHPCDIDLRTACADEKYPGFVAKAVSPLYYGWPRGARIGALEAEILMAFKMLPNVLIDQGAGLALAFRVIIAPQALGNAVGIVEVCGEKIAVFTAPSAFAGPVGPDHDG